MAQLFVSYASAHRTGVAELASDLSSLGHEVWFDQELTGGQAWWDHILRQIRDCDAFLLVVTDETLDSEACRRELAYALALRKPLLPVRLDAPVDLDHVPPEVSQRQIVDYGVGDKAGVLALNRATKALPPAPAPPDPLPSPPPVPISYVAEIIEEIRRKDELSYDEQIAIVFRLRDHLEKSRGDASGVKKAFETLLRRRELYAQVRDEIHQAMARAGDPLPPPPTTQGQGARPAAAPVRASPHPRDANAGLGCALGAVAFLFPLAGLVMFVVFLAQQRPRAAGEAIGWAIVGFVATCFCGLFLQAFVAGLESSYQPYPPAYQGF